MCQSKAAGGRRCFSDWSDRRVAALLPTTCLDGVPLPAWPDVDAALTGGQLAGNQLTTEVIREALELARVAVACEANVTKAVLAGCGEGTHFARLQSRVKSPMSLARKLASDAQRHIDRSLLDLAAEINDVLRYTHVSDERDLSSCLGALAKALDAAGYRLREALDLFRASRYRGFHVTFAAPDGLLFEVQFHTHASLQHAESSHADYEIWRDRSRPRADRNAALQRLVSGAAAVSSPPGLPDQLLGTQVKKIV